MSENDIEESEFDHHQEEEYDQQNDYQNNTKIRTSALSRDIIPRCVDVIVLDDNEEVVNTSVIEHHQLVSKGQILKSFEGSRSKSKTALSSAKHYNKNKKSINTKRREDAGRRRSIETPEKKEERLKKRREARKKKIKEAHEMMENMLQREEGSECVDQNNIRGKYKIVKKVEIEKKIVYTHEFEPLNEGSFSKGSGAIVKISGRFEDGSDISGGFKICKLTETSKIRGTHT